MREAPLILVVEDDEHDVELTTRVLMRARVANRVVAVRDGVEALHWLLREGEYSQRRHESIALVLLDLRLPRMNGLEVLRHLRNDDRTRTLPIVIVTASSSEDDRKASFECGADAVVSKPLRLAELAEASRHLQLRWLLVESASAES